jgi:anti-anti-sigma factor
MLTAPFELEQIGEVTLVRLAGQRLLDGAQVEDLGEALLRLASDPGRARMRLDFGAIEFLSSAVLPVLLSLRQALQAQGGRLALCGLRPGVREVFVIAGLEQALNVHPTERDALHSLR